MLALSPEDFTLIIHEPKFHVNILKIYIPQGHLGLLEA
jgi:hypothetical protein